MKRILNFLFCAALLLICGCQPKPFLTVDPANLQFGQDGGSQTVHVSANYAWTASVSGTCLTVSPSSGEGEASVTITASPASAADPATGSITFRSEGLSASVSVTQEAKSAITVGSVTKIPAEGGTFTVDIRYNTDFSVEIEAGAQSWIAFNGTKALESGKLMFSFTANENSDPRTGKATINDKSGRVAPITLTFEQEEKKVLELIKEGEIMVSAAGGTIEVDVRYNTDFSVEINAEDKSWVTFVQTKALKNGKLEFLFAANETPDLRNAVVTVKDKSGKIPAQYLTFVQLEKRMIQTDEGLRIPEEGGTFELNVWYNVDFNVEVDPDATSWITYIQTKSLTQGRMEFKFEPNEGEERSGHVYLKDKAGDLSPVTLTFVQDERSKKTTARLIMEEIYEAMDAGNWTNEPWKPGVNMPGYYFDTDNEKVTIWIQNQGVKGEIPDCIGAFGDMLEAIHITDEPDLTGPLPDSFSKLVGLKHLYIYKTGMTAVPDVFGDMKQLEYFAIVGNPSMTGPLPASLNSPFLEHLDVYHCCFVGELPASWGKYAAIMDVSNNRLTGKLSHIFQNEDDLNAFVNSEQGDNLWQQEGYGFDISDLDIPGGDMFWPEGDIEDLDGNLFNFRDVIKNNRYTVYVSWAPWCVFSSELMPELRDYYAKYCQDGLEVIATIQTDVTDDGAGKPWTDHARHKQEVETKGYGNWYNFLFTDYVTRGFLNLTPAAEVYDAQGHIVFSYEKYPDPARNRFNKTASFDLIPFLESIFGPAEDPDTYESKDYSKDGEVIILQRASVGKGINIVFMGDAYTDKDMAPGGTYETVMKQAMEEFFAIEPYKSFRNHFNVYAVKVVSKNGRIGEGYTTALSTFFGVGAYMEGNHDKCYEYALKVPGITSREDLLVTVVANTRRHAGTTFMFADNMSCVAYIPSMANDPSVFGSILRHEAGGHGFGFLADEYVQFNETAPAEHIAEYNEAYEKYGWYANVDFTNDPEKIRWSRFLADERYKGEIGIYEGGALYTKGAYRPTVNSMMRENMEYFNAPSRWAIYQRIMERSGMDCSFEQFLEYDAVNRAGAAGTKSAPVRPPMKDAANKRFVPTAPPVIVR